MFQILAAQMLPLILVVLGAALGAAVTDWLKRPLLISAVLAMLALALAGYLVWKDAARERRVAVIGEKIRAEIDHASGIEYRMLDAGERAALESRPFDPAAFLRESEDWRKRVDEMLKRELPGSGADIRFRTGGGDVSRGWGVSIYTRLGVLRGNLMAVLDNLPSYVQRSW